MNLTYLTRMTFGSAAFTLLSGVTVAQPVTPVYDSFANLSAPQLTLITFGGTGINSSGPVALSQFTYLGATVYLALSATPRVTQTPAFTGPPVTNNGMGTYFAQPAQSPPFSPGENNAGWNFNYAVATNSSLGIGGLLGLGFQLLVDSNPGVGTDVSAHTDASGLFLLGLQNSQNLGFGPAFPSFDPMSPGEYTFALKAYNKFTHQALDQVAMRVTVVPEPEAYGMALAGMGVVGFAILRRRRATAS